MPGQMTTIGTEQAVKRLEEKRRQTADSKRRNPESGLSRKAIRDKVMRRDRYTCQRCGESFEDSRPLEAAHVVPDSEGGEYTPENLRAMCIKCHSGYDGWDIEDWPPGKCTRVKRVATYVSDKENRHGQDFVRRCAGILGVTPERAQELLDKRL